MTQEEIEQLKEELYTIMHKCSINTSLTKILTLHLHLDGLVEKNCIEELAVVLEERMIALKENINKTHHLMKL